MSDSFKHTPVVVIKSNDVMKRRSNRKERRIVKEYLRQGEDTINIKHSKIGEPDEDRIWGPNVDDDFDSWRKDFHDK
jgi:hypothetical protein